MRLNSCFLIILLGLMTSCEQERAIRAKVRSVLLGRVESKPAPVVATPKATTPPTDISPHQELIELLRAFDMSPDTTFSTRLLASIDKQKAVLVKKDDEFLSGYEKLVHHFESSNIAVLKVMMLIYAKLEGNNRPEMARSLSVAFETMPEALLLESMAAFPNRCEIAAAVHDKISPEQAIAYLIERRGKILSIKTESLASYIKQCSDEVDLEIFRLKSSIVVPTPTPVVTPKPIVDSFSVPPSAASAASTSIVSPSSPTVNAPKPPPAVNNIYNPTN